MPKSMKKRKEKRKEKKEIKDSTYFQIKGIHPKIERVASRLCGRTPKLHSNDARNPKRPMPINMCQLTWLTHKGDTMAYHASMFTRIKIVMT